MKILLLFLPLTSFAFSEEEANPLFFREWYQTFYEEDSRGILSGLKNSLKTWSFNDEIVHNHDLPDDLKGKTKERKKIITGKMLKFFERKVFEEGKKSDLAAVAKVNNSSTSLDLSDSIRFKFRGKLFQGNGSMLIINPFLDFNVQYDLRKGPFFEGFKKFEDFSSTLNYNIKENLTTFRVNRGISRDVNAEITYQNGPVTPNAGDVSLRLLFSRGF